MYRGFADRSRNAEKSRQGRRRYRVRGSVVDGNIGGTAAWGGRSKPRPYDGNFNGYDLGCLAGFLGLAAEECWDVQVVYRNFVNYFGDVSGYLGWDILVFAG